MSSLASHPFYTLLIMTLLILYVHIGKSAYGRYVPPRKIGSILARNNTLIIDIRDKERFDVFHIKGSIHEPDAKKYRSHKTSGITKVVFIYDSNIRLAEYQRVAGIEQYSNKIGCLFMPDYQVFAAQQCAHNRLVGIDTPQVSS